MVRRCPSTQPGFAGTPEPLVFRTGPSRLHAARPWCRPERPARTTSPSSASPSRKDGDIPKASSPATHSALRWPQLQGPRHHLQGLLRSSNGSSAGVLRHTLPLRTAALAPRSNSRADTAVCPPTPGPAGSRKPGTSRPGSWPPCPVCRSTDGPLPPTSCPAWGSRCRPVPTPPQGVPAWAISTPATGQLPRHHPKAIR